MEKMVYQVIGYLQRILLTPTCIACGNRSTTDLDLCGFCQQQLTFNLRCCARCSIPLVIAEPVLCGSCLRRPPRYQSSYCAFEYGYPIAELVRTLKYGHSLSHAKVLGTLLASYLQQRHRDDWPQCIVPVPLSTERYLHRGFNQAIELGRIVESRLQIPMNTQLLHRVRHTIEQAGLSRRERKKNLRNAFAVTSNVIPDHIAILDDVVTTGSTMNE